jgi:spore coat protein U-like protein
MKKQIVTLLLPLSILAIPALSLAATANDTETLIATASVSAKCVINNTTNVAFGTVDPTTNGNYDGAGSIVTHCSKNTLEFLWIAPSIAGALKMTSPTTLDSITYALYSDAGRTTAFPSATGGAKTIQSGSAIVTNVYGRVVVAAGVNNTIAAANDYTQSLTATIEW